MSFKYGFDGMFRKYFVAILTWPCFLLWKNKAATFYVKSNSLRPENTNDEDEEEGKLFNLLIAKRVYTSPMQ